MSAQPIHTDEQIADPQVRARLESECKRIAKDAYRQRIIRGSRTMTAAEYMARKGL